MVTTADFFRGSNISTGSDYFIYSFLFILRFFWLLFKVVLFGCSGLELILIFLLIVGGGKGGWIFLIGGGGFRKGLDANPCIIFVYLKSIGVEFSLNGIGKIKNE